MLVFDVTLQLNGMLIQDAKMCERGLKLIEEQ